MYLTWIKSSVLDISAKSWAIKLLNSVSLDISSLVSNSSRASWIPDKLLSINLKWDPRAFTSEGISTFCEGQILKYFLKELKSTSGQGVLLMIGATGFKGGI